MKQSPLYEQIYREILEQIQNGTFCAGDRLPSEKELSEQYHVSRITSKKALEMLSDAGLVVRMPGKGSFVSDQNLRQQVSSLQKREENGGNVIGVILDGFGPSFGCQLLGSIEAECQRQGISMVLHCSYGKMEEESRAISQMRRLGVDGILIMCVHDENYNASILQMVVEHFPVVTIDRQLKGIPVSFVGTDNESAARELAGYLLDDGYKKICFVKPCAVETSTVQDRMNGFRMAYNERGMVADENLWIMDMKATLPMYFGEEQLEKDMGYVTKFIREHREIEAFFAVEYSIARIIYRCLYNMGLHKKYPVVCFDSSENIMNESMFTHVKQDEGKIGRLGVQILMDAIHGNKEIRSVQVPYQIIEVTDPAID